MSEFDDVFERVVERLGVGEAEKLLGLPVFSIDGRDALLRAISRVKERALEGQASLVLGDERTLQGEVDAGLLVLWVHVCPDCGTRIEGQSVKNESWPPRCFECNGIDHQDQSLMDGKPMVPMELPVRKLPDAFKHLDSAKRTGVNQRFIAKLVAGIDQQRQATVTLRDAGGFAHNARIILRFAAERAGASVTQGAIRVRGTGPDARVTFFVDAGEGVGAEVPPTRPRGTLAELIRPTT